nr:zinc finger protein 595-like [Aedes albopictus]
METSWICRVCMGDCTAESLQFEFIFEPTTTTTAAVNGKDGHREAAAPNLAEMLSFCGQLTITPDDELPKIICSACSHQLSAAYRFCIKCRSSDGKLRDRLLFSNRANQSTVDVSSAGSVDDDQQIPDRIVDDLIELPTAKPKDQNEILMDLMMRPEDELFDEIIEQEQFSADEESECDGSFEQLAEKVQIVTVDGEAILEVPEYQDESMDDDLITVSEHTSDVALEITDDFVHDKEDDESLAESLRQMNAIMPPEEMIVEREDYENFQIIVHAGFACCNCKAHFSSEEDLNTHCCKHDLSKKPLNGVFCSFCYKTFSRLSSKERHDAQRSMPKMYLCKLCEYVCHDRAVLNHHMKVASTHKKPMIDFDKVNEVFEKLSVEGHLCCECFSIFRDTGQLEKHYKDAHHINRPDTELEALKMGNFWCANCHQVFKHSHRYQSHLKRSKVKSIYRCLKVGCTYRTGSIVFARLHLTSRDHKVSGITSDDTISVNQSRTLEKHRCCFRKCLKIFESRTSLLAHVDQAHQVKLLENELRRKSSTHVCSICSRNFESRRALKRHQSVKMEINVCEHCGLSVPSAIQLRSHVQQVHSNDQIQKNFKCDECSCSFVTEANLQRHKRRGHDKPTDNVCSICGKQFMTKTGLWYHWRMHNKSETFECAPCKNAGRRYEFRDAKTLRRHYKISEMHNAERKHKCTYEGCTNTYIHKPDLQRHEQTVHRGDRPFLCKTCGKGFVRNRDLRLHERHHTGAKLFSCEECSAGFDIFMEYKRHCSEKHGRKLIMKYAK